MELTPGGQAPAAPPHSAPPFIQPVAFAVPPDCVSGAGWQRQRQGPDAPHLMLRVHQTCGFKSHLTGTYWVHLDLQMKRLNTINGGQKVVQRERDGKTRGRNTPTR